MSYAPWVGTSHRRAGGLDNRSSIHTGDELRPPKGLGWRIPAR